MSIQDAANLALLVIALGLGAAVLLPRRRGDHRSWGIRPDRGTPGRYLLGVGLAALAIAAPFVVLLLTGVTDVRGGEPQAGEIVAIAVYFVVLAGVEELVFRGLLLNGVIELTGRPVVAVPLVALAVAVPYLFADGVTPLSFVSAVLAGIMYGVAFLITTSVWTAAGMRASWNLTLGPVLGFEVSGQSLVDHPVLEQTLDGARWVTGGAYGPEGGLVVVLARVLLISGLLWWGAQAAARHGDRLPSRG
ncbi:CPBP family intramembrane metalloprotease [Nocardioides rotundus]|uniref:CPBP family intramembrane glutamic endopeptidase n=1 Tax=Nocardioides rotundus TaxID=1774216 RepID=UPI001CC1A13E|nr:CPBP family intramembrane glutamic endopeptidase [Nocardioides rotundus]UAL29833.1 CPBP family intramembrane metalloprotease [Nocardioides rotundus]